MDIYLQEQVLETESEGIIVNLLWTMVGNLAIRRSNWHGTGRYSFGHGGLVVGR